MKQAGAGLAVLLAVLIAGGGRDALAADDFFDALAGVSVEEGGGAPPGGLAVESGSATRFRGELGYRLRYAVREQRHDLPFKRQDRGLVSSRTGLRFTADHKVNDDLVFRLGGRALYDAADELERQEQQIDEAFADLKSDAGWRLKVGRQLVVFGQSEYFQVLDLVNPRDERELGLAELSETRLPVGASRISYVAGRTGLDLVLKQEFRPHRVGAGSSDFDPYVTIGGSDTLARQSQPRVDVSHPDLIVRGFVSGPWGDLSAIAAQVHEPAPTLVDFSGGQLVLGHPAKRVFGAGGNYVVGDWVVKGEWARHTRGRFPRRDIDGQLMAGIARPEVSATKPLVELMIGTRYSGVSNLTVDTEVLVQRIDRYEAAVADPRTRRVGVMNLMWQGWHDTLRIETLVSRWWDGGSGLARFRVEYDATDAWTLHAGYIDYRGSAPNSLLSPFRNNDRVFAGAAYSF